MGSRRERGGKSSSGGKVKRVFTKAQYQARSSPLVKFLATQSIVSFAVTGIAIGLICWSFISFTPTANKRSRRNANVASSFDANAAVPVIDLDSLRADTTGDDTVDDPGMSPQEQEREMHPERTFKRTFGMEPFNVDDQMRLLEQQRERYLADQKQKLEDMKAQAAQMRAQLMQNVQQGMPPPANAGPERAAIGAGGPVAGAQKL